MKHAEPEQSTVAAEGRPRSRRAEGRARLTPNNPVEYAATVIDAGLMVAAVGFVLNLAGVFPLGAAVASAAIVLFVLLGLLAVAGLVVDNVKSTRTGAHSKAAKATSETTHTAGTPGAPTGTRTDADGPVETLPVPVDAQAPPYANTDRGRKNRPGKAKRDRTPKRPETKRGSKHDVLAEALAQIEADRAREVSSAYTDGTGTPTAAVASLSAGKRRNDANIAV